MTWLQSTIRSQRSKKPSVEEDQSLDVNTEIKATADASLAKTYKLRVVEGVKIAPSPTWLQITLWNAGIRPINNVVDVTNYILLKYGQPLHSFDKDKIDGDIVVRNAKKKVKNWLLWMKMSMNYPQMTWSFQTMIIRLP